MDNLVLVRVAATLDARLRGSVLRDVRQDTQHRIRLVLEDREQVRSISVSLRPELPWIGRPVARSERRAGRFGSPMVGACRKALRGAVLEGVSKPGWDRVIRICFADGHVLVAELATHGANLVLLDHGENLLACARRPRSAQERLTIGRPYRPPSVPERLLVPVGREPEQIDRFLREKAWEGESAYDALRRHCFGVGSEGARLVLDEALATTRSPGTVLIERLTQLDHGEVDPVVESPLDPLEAAVRGDTAPQQMRLLPWEPPERETPIGRYRRGDPAGTAGLYHEAVEQMVVVGERARGLLSLLGREIERARAAEQNAERDLGSFADPEVHRRGAEALLAGLTRARRVGDVALVPDPYDADGREIAVPAPAALTLQAAAEELFRMHRRARRGREQASARRSALAERRKSLERLAVSFEDVRGVEGVERFEVAMREERLPVGLHASRRARSEERLKRPRLEGVRVYQTTEGLMVLAGRSGRDNHRLTFKLSSPDDFWIHALGCRGAHVILRNDGRRARPPAVSLEQAASVAAWFSEARKQPVADVQWTRRKNVRKPRGAAPGTVVLKRFETIRVRPALPAGQSGDPTGKFA